MNDQQTITQSTLQSPRPMRYILASGFVACVIAGVLIVWVSLPEPGTASRPLPSREEVGIEPNIGSTIPSNLQFRDEDGNPVQLSDLVENRPVILAPVYFECPMLCNLTMNGLVRGLRGLSLDVGKDFSVVTLSFDPREGPALAAAAKETALTRYGRDGAAEGWHFLTGDEEPIRKLTDALGFRYTFDEQTGEYAHAAGLFIISPEGEIRRFLGGVDFAPRDLKLALAESEGIAGGGASLTEQALLLCFDYDPTQGKYGLAILRLIRFTGILTVGALATGIAVMIRRQRQAENPTLPHELTTEQDLG